MATIYRRADYRLEETKSLVAPKICINKESRIDTDEIGKLSKIIFIYNFGCTKYQYRPIDGIYHFCPSCVHRVVCDINSQKFYTFYVQYRLCPKCFKHNLSRFYVYLLYKMKDFIDPDKRECCWCRGEEE